MSESTERFEKHIPVPVSGISIVDLLAEHVELSRQQIKAVMQKGAVWVSKGKSIQRCRRAKRMLTPAETVHIYYDKHVLDGEPAEPMLIADFGAYSIWNKPYGLLSQGSKWGDHCTVTRWAEQHLQPQRNAFVVHRLDRAANGLIMIAHEKRAAAALSALFQTRDIDKRYRIWVEGHFPEQEPVKVTKPIDERHAASLFEFIRYDEKQDRSLLDVKIETGRKHQIRRHAASLGYPVVGDRLYGSNPQHAENLQLTAYYLKFTCPLTGQNRLINLLAED